jgi:hypothetical protein
MLAHRASVIKLNYATNVALSPAGLRYAFYYIKKYGNYKKVINKKLKTPADLLLAPQA